MRHPQSDIALWLLSGALAVSALARGAGAQLEIKTYRFHLHPEGFERLVLQFKKGPLKAGAPGVKVTNGEKGAVITVSSASLVGAIPEAAINDTFGAHAKGLASVAIDTDTPAGGFSLKVGLKGRNPKVDAFYLASPARLVIDVYSDGKGGAKRNLASRWSRRGGKHHAAHGDRKNDFLCFPSSSQVAANVAFGEDDAPTEIEIEGKAVGGGSDKAISCYPRDQQVKAHVTFRPLHEAPAEVSEKKPEHPTPSETISSLPKSPAVTAVPTPAAPTAGLLPSAPAAPPPAPAPAVASPLLPAAPTAAASPFFPAAPVPSAAPALPSFPGLSTPPRNVSNLPALPALGGTPAAASPSANSPMSLLPPLGAPAAPGAGPAGSLNSLLPPLN